MRLQATIHALLLVLLLALAPTVQGGDAEEGNPLSPLAWLVGGRWVAEVTPPEGEPFFREARYEWTPNRRLLRFESLIRQQDGSATPYQDGFYGWHPGEKKVLFTSFDPQGNYYRGEVGIEGNSLPHLIEGVSTAGETARYRVVVTRAAPDRYNFSLQAPQEGEWVEVVSLVYERQE